MQTIHAELEVTFGQSLKELARRQEQVAHTYQKLALSTRALARKQQSVGEILSRLHPDAEVGRAIRARVEALQVSVVSAKRHHEHVSNAQQLALANEAAAAEALERAEVLWWEVGDHQRRQKVQRAPEPEPEPEPVPDEAEASAPRSAAEVVAEMVVGILLFFIWIIVFAARRGE